MSRSGYSDDCDEGLGLWRGAVSRAINGKRGQAMLTELAAALDAMPAKALAADSLVTAEGEYCTLGALGAKRGMDMAPIDPEDWDAVAAAFGVAPAMVREIVYMNDECETGGSYIDGKWTYQPETPERRWKRMRAWVAEQLASTPNAVVSGSGTTEHQETR